MSVLQTLHVFLQSSTMMCKHFLLTPCRKYPELFGSFKTLLGFKDPGLPEQLPTNASLPPYPPKERVTEFAAEIGEGVCGLNKHQRGRVHTGVCRSMYCALVHRDWPQPKQRKTIQKSRLRRGEDSSKPILTSCCHHPSPSAASWLL